MKIFGAYVHARPDGRIFYVGKGTDGHLSGAQNGVLTTRSVGKTLHIVRKSLLLTPAQNIVMKPAPK